MSKFSLDVLNRCVHPYLQYHDPDIILGAVVGEDVALTRVGNSILVSHLDPIVGAVKNIGWLAVHVACNDIATSGAPPRWVLLLVLMAEIAEKLDLDEVEFKRNNWIKLGETMYLSKALGEGREGTEQFLQSSALEACVEIGLRATDFYTKRQASRQQTWSQVQIPSWRKWPPKCWASHWRM